MQFGQFRPTRGQIAGFVLLIVTVFSLGWMHTRIVFGDPSPATASSQQTVTVMPAAQPTAAPSATPPATPTPQATYTPPPFAPNAIEVYPAVGERHGTVVTGTSVYTNESWAHGLRYYCGSHYQRVYIDYLQTVDYNGTVIDFSDRWNPNPGNPSPNDQSQVSLTFTDGNLASLQNRLTSIIVHHDTTYGGYYDETVINVNASMVTPNGIMMNTHNVADSAYVSGFTLCIR